MQCWETARLTMLVPHTAPYDETHHVFMTLPRYTCTNEDDVPPIVEGTMRHLTQHMHFTLHHLMAIYKEIMEKGWSEHKQSFVQYYGSDAIDASALLISLTRFTAEADPRIVRTIDRIQQELMHEPHVYRYRVDAAADDGLVGHEGTFSICSFWLVEALTRTGRLEEARQNLEQMLTYANHLGLYSEEIGPVGEALGNFPQAFTHLALIRACYALDQALGKSSSDQQ